MIPYIENCYFISRKNNIIIANLEDGQQVHLIKLKQKFIDVIILEGEAYKYMERYIEMFPHLVEILENKDEEKHEQFSLF